MGMQVDQAIAGGIPAKICFDLDLHDFYFW